MSAYKNTANDYNNVHDNVCSYIKNRQDLYSEMLDKLVYDLLFFEYILSLDELSTLTFLITSPIKSLLSTNIIDKEKIDMIHAVCT